MSASVSGARAGPVHKTEGGPADKLTKVAFIMAPTPLAAVREEVSLLGELMPQKSTFFYPKLATGLTA